MNRSEAVNELTTALAKAQAVMSGAKKDAENPHFRSKYADLASVWEACREALTKNGLSVVQSPRLVGVGESGWLVEVETTLFHSSGQFVSDTLAVPVTKVDAQGVGSALTYARRYSLSAFVGVAPEDDDANAAVGGSRPTAKQTAPSAPSRASQEPRKVTVGVSGVLKSASGDRFTISGDDRGLYVTSNKAHAEIAKGAQEAGSKILITYLQGERDKTVVALVDTSDEEPPF